mmetsp:Transcript_71595/g.222073  ORF Transcript_71595/g.222073 Transcript_71595/m.222073 type:complete len:374 (-) Transcript_71595:31-1152(-)
MPRLSRHFCRKPSSPMWPRSIQLRHWPLPAAKASTAPRERTSRGPCIERNCGQFRKYFLLQAPSPWGLRCCRRRSGKNTASGSTFTVKSCCRKRLSLPTACQAFLKVCTFAAVPSLDLPQGAMMMGMVMTPPPKSVLPSLNTAMVSHAAKPLFCWICCLRMSISKPGRATDQQKSVGRPWPFDSSLGLGGGHGLGQSHFPWEWNIAWKSSKVDFSWRPGYHSGCSWIPSSQAQMTFLWQGSPSTAVWQGGSVDVDGSVAFAAGAGVVAAAAAAAAAAQTPPAQATSAACASLPSRRACGAFGIPTTLAALGMPSLLAARKRAAVDVCAELVAVGGGTCAEPISKVRERTTIAELPKMTCRRPHIRPSHFCDGI